MKNKKIVERKSARESHPYKRRRGDEEKQELSQELHKKAGRQKTGKKAGGQLKEKLGGRLSRRK